MLHWLLEVNSVWVAGFQGGPNSYNVGWTNPNPDQKAQPSE